MEPSPEAMHRRYIRQAQWTQSLRDHLYQLVKIEQAQRILEVGCGSGVILKDISLKTDAVLYGLDFDFTYTKLAMRIAHDSIILQADGHHIPFPTSSFDVCFCHFLLLWVDNPIIVLQEMIRVTKPGGYVCALAEPDYGGRIDYPLGLVKLGGQQTRALALQGANPWLGRQLRSLLHRAGLEHIVAGVLGGQWETPFIKGEWESEWAVLEHDLNTSDVTQENYQDLKTQDLKAWENGERILFVPTFFAWGKVPD